MHIKRLSLLVTFGIPLVESLEDKASEILSGSKCLFLPLRTFYYVGKSVWPAFTTELSSHVATIIPETGALSCVGIIQIMSAYHNSMK